MNYIYSISLIYLLYALLFHNQIIFTSSQYAIQLWLETLIPSLFFPTLMIRLLFDYLPNFPLRYPLIGMLLGYPNFAIYLEQQHQLSTTECKKLLYSMNSCSLPFLCITIGQQLPSILHTLSLLCVLILSQLLPYILLKPKIILPISNTKEPLLTRSRKHMYTLAQSFFLMGGYILIIHVLFALLPLPTFLKLFMEFSSGCFYVLQHHASLPLLGAIIAFGSFSIHLQTLSSLQNIKIQYTTKLFF